MQKLWFLKVFISNFLKLDFFFCNLNMHVFTGTKLLVPCRNVDLNIPREYYFIRYGSVSVTRKFWCRQLFESFIMKSTIVTRSSEFSRTLGRKPSFIYLIQVECCCQISECFRTGRQGQNQAQRLEGVVVWADLESGAEIPFCTGGSWEMSTTRTVILLLWLSAHC